MKEWLAADADGRDVRDQGLGQGIACDPSGCVGKLPDGRLVSYALTPDAFEDDCQRAAVIVTTREAPPDCTATVIGRSTWRERGAMTLSRNGSGFAIELARPPNFDRPWSPNPAPHQPRSAGTASSDNAGSSHASTRTQPRDATPRSEDLQADD